MEVTLAAAGPTDRRSRPSDAMEGRRWSRPARVFWRRGGWVGDAVEFDGDAVAGGDRRPPNRPQVATCPDWVHDPTARGRVTRWCRSPPSRQGCEVGARRERDRDLAVRPAGHPPVADVGTPRSIDTRRTWTLVAQGYRRLRDLAAVARCSGGGDGGGVGGGGDGQGLGGRAVVGLVTPSSSTVMVWPEAMDGRRTGRRWRPARTGCTTPRQVVAATVVSVTAELTTVVRSVSAGT